jgi:hypothetical protein
MLRKEEQMKNDVVFKFSHPSGTAGRKPSMSLANAVQQLTEADELKLLASEAREHGRKLMVQVFHSANGCPILIHLGVVSEKSA